MKDSPPHIGHADDCNFPNTEVWSALCLNTRYCGLHLSTSVYLLLYLDALCFPATHKCKVY